MLLPIIASSIIGGLIGYGTNWLAIKMLFRPLEEKRIKGFKLPFTPGLIPKQRGMLAKSIGRAVGRYLLTPEALLNSLESSEFDQTVESFLRQRIQSYSQADLKILDWLANHNLLQLTRQLVKKLANFVEDLMQQETTQNFVGQKTCALANYILEKCPSEFTNKSLNIQELLVNRVTDPKVKQHLTMKSSSLLLKLSESQQSVADLVPDELQDFLREWLAGYTPTLLEKLENFIRSPQFDTLLQKVIDDYLSSGWMGKLLGSFVDSDTIGQTIKPALFKALENDETKLLFEELIVDLLSGIAHKPFNTLLAELSEDSVTDKVQQIANILMTEETGQWLGAKAESFAREHSHKTGRQLIENIFGEDIDIIGTVDYLTREIISSPAFIKQLRLLTYDTMDFILQQRPGKFLKRVDDSTILKLKSLVLIALRKFIIKYEADLMKALQVPEMIEKQVNKLDVKEVEDILLSVMNNQLSNITNLGLLLGAIIGLMMPFINLWLMGL